jgi:plasmid maintenance system antidote protein VapI
MATRRPTITETLRQRLIAEFESGTSLRTIEADVGVIRQSLAKFIRHDQSLRLDMADKLAERYGLELKPAKKLKGR